MSATCSFVALRDTIAGNPRFAAPEAADEELWDARRRARLEQLVRSLPGGLDTVMGDREYRLSGGERWYAR